MSSDGIHPEKHLAPSELAAYLDNQLAPADRARVEAHLTACDECRAESAAVVQILSTRRRVRQRWAILLPAGVAAAALVVLVIRPSGQPNSVGDSLRNDSAVASREGVPAIEVLSPRAEVVRPDSVLFAWRPANLNALYHFVLSDTLGDVVWQHETRDTLLLLPSSVRLERDRTYFWRVDALLTGALSAATQTQRFRTAQ